MPRMVNPMPDQPDRRLQADRAELADLIGRALPHDGKVDLQPGLHLHRLSVAGRSVHGVSEPSFCVVAQGSKDVLVGDARLRYDPAHYLITTLGGLPAVGTVTEASGDRPYLSVRLVLDPAVVTSVMAESAVPRSPCEGRGGVQALAVSPLGASLLDATLRLVRLARTPVEFRVLGPLVMREIVFRLLTGAQADRLLHLAMVGGHGHRMARAVRRISEGFDQPLRVEDVARDLGMSASAFHAHFKAVTAMSPLQFQKQLRLREARRLMLSEHLDAGEAGYRVGYEDQSHFSREYKRHFGEPPMRDVERLRDMATA